MTDHHADDTGAAPARGRKPRKPKSAYDRALGLLARREHSKWELRNKLRAKGYARDEIDEAVEKLAEQGYQSDERFAGMLIRTRAAALYGPVRIRMELRQRFIANDLIDYAMQEYFDFADISDRLFRRMKSRGFDESDEYKWRTVLKRRGFVE